MEQRESAHGIGPFIAELRRRHVGRVAIAYVAVWFVVLQTAEIVFSAFLPGFEADAGLRVLVVGFVALLPVVLAMAWVYELTPHGIRTMDALDAASGRTPTRRLLPRAALAVLMLVAGGAAYTGWYRMDSEAVAQEQVRRETARAAFADALAPAAPLSLTATRVGDPDTPPALDIPAAMSLVVEGSSVTRIGDELHVTLRLVVAPPEVDPRSAEPARSVGESTSSGTES